MLNNDTDSRSRRASASGYTLLELIVSLGVFLVISAAAFSLVAKHLPLFTSQQNQSALNFGLRNAAAQIQIDMANAGSGFYPSADVTSWPIGVTIESPGVATTCYDATSHTYSQDCFDTLRVIKTDPSTPPAQIGKENGQDDCDKAMSVNQSSTLFIQPASTFDTLDSLASHYKKKDQILVISSRYNGDRIGTAILSQDANKTGQGVKLNHNPSAADGTNTSDNDHYLISTTGSNKLLADFCTGDWVVKISPAVYRVDASDPTNPKLARLHPDDSDCPPDATTPFNSKCIIAEQVIGFRVGALIRDPNISTDPNDCKPYCYKPASYGSDWSQIRALRITIIGRTTPATGTVQYHNNFDGGPYKIEAISVVVSPRSLTMRDEL